MWCAHSGDTALLKQDMVTWLNQEINEVQSAASLGMVTIAQKAWFHWHPSYSRNGIMKLFHAQAQEIESTPTSSQPGLKLLKNHGKTQQESFIQEHSQNREENQALSQGPLNASVGKAVICRCP